MTIYASFMGDGGGSSTNPINTANVNLYDDFIGATLDPTSLILTSTNTWFTNHLSAANPTNATDSNHPGVVTFGELTSGDPNHYLFLSRGTITPNKVLPILLGGGVLEVSLIVNIATLSSVANGYVLRFGLGDTSAGDQANGAYFEYSHSINTGQWVVKTASASTRTTNNTSTTVTTGWYNFRIVVNANASTVQFLLDGVSLAVINTNIPTANPISVFFDINWAAGTVPANFIQFDACYLNQTLTTSR